jgi:orotate phosphoribosyltransferase
VTEKETIYGHTNIPRNLLCDLLKQHSVKFGEFTLRSGKKSDFYVDCRPVILSHYGHDLVSRVLSGYLDPYNCTHIAVLGMGASHMASAVCANSPLSVIHVRDARKDHGTRKLVELPHDFTAGSVVAVVDDVLTTGSSVEKCVTALMAEHSIVPVVCMVLVDRQEGGAEYIASTMKIPVRSVFRRTDFSA